MQQRIFQERKPQRRANRTAECQPTSVFPARCAPAGDSDELDELLTTIEAVLAQCAV